MNDTQVLNKRVKAVKTVFGLLFFLCLMLGFFPKAALADEVNTWSPDDETPSYVISTAADLDVFRASINDTTNTYEGITITLGKDINVVETQQWAEVSKTGAFKGIFDGKGHTIYGFNDVNCGIFYDVQSNGQVFNLNVEFAVVNPPNNYGGIVNHYLYGTIDSCSVSGSITGAKHLSGFAHQVNDGGLIKNSISNANISSPGKNVAGLTRTFSGTGNALNCYTRGTLDGGNIYAIGRNADEKTATTCYYLDTINVTSDERKCGNAKTADELKTQASYTDWDFADIWQIDAGVNDGYPTLRQTVKPIEKKTVNLKAIITIENKAVTEENASSLPDDFLQADYTIKLVSADGTISEDELEQYEVKLEPIGTTTSVKFTGLESTEGIDFTEQFKSALSSSKYKLTYKTNDKYNFEFFADTGYPLITPECNKPTFTFYENTTYSDEQKEAAIAATETRIQESLAYYLPSDVSGHDAVFGAGNNQYGSWLIFTSARAGYTPHAGFFDECYQAFAEKYTTSGKVTGEGKPLNEGFDVNEVAKDALAITAMGYDARNVAGYNLIEMLTNGKNPSDGYFQQQVSSFAIDSYDYLPGTQQAYAVELAKKALAGQSTGNDPLIDMYIMGYQPLAAYYDPNAQEGTDLYYVKQAMETVFIPYFSRIQGYTGVFYSGISYNNPWSNAQVYIMLGMADADIFQTTFIKNGFSMLDSLAPVSQSFGADQGQIARGYEAVVRAYHNENQLFDCTDVVNSTVRVNNAIAALPEMETIIDNATKATAQEKLTAVDALLTVSESKLILTEIQKSSIDMTKYNKVKAWVEGKDADGVEAMIAELPDDKNLQLADQTAVIAARYAYNNLIKEEKDKVANYDKLVAAEIKIQAIKDANNQNTDQTKANQVTTLINALGTITSLNQETQINAARAAYDGLNDIQKGLVSGETLAKLVAAEAALKGLKSDITITVDVERFTIGQGFYIEPTTITLKTGDTPREALIKLLGADNLTGHPDYLRAIVGADTGVATIPDYIVKEYPGAGNSAVANDYGQKFGGSELGEFDYSNYSGWMYFVNNVTPGTAINQYQLKNGDVVRVAFTYWATGGDLTGIGYIGPDPANRERKDMSFIPANKDGLIKAIAKVNGNTAYLQDTAIKTAYDDAMTTVQDMTASLVKTNDATNALTKAIADYKPGDPANDAKLAKVVTDQIAALPAVAKLTLTDKDAVIAARTAYDALTTAQKALVTNLSTLTTAEAKITELQNAADKVAAKAVTDKIAALPTVAKLVLTDKDAVAAARSAYDALTAAQQALVTNQKTLTAAEAQMAKLLAGEATEADKAAAKAASDLIAGLPSGEKLALGSKADVVAARTVYNKLTDIQKALVTNLDALAVAEARIAELEAATPPAKDEATGIEVVGLPEGVGLKVEPESGDADKTNEAEKAATEAGIKDAKVVSLYSIKPDMSDEALSEFNNNPDSFVTLTMPLGDDQQGYDSYKIYHKKTDGTVEWITPILSADGKSLLFKVNAFSEFGVVGTKAAEIPAVDFSYRTHVQNVGWQDWKNNGAMSGTQGQSLRLEGIEIKRADTADVDLGIRYETHIENIGWEDSWKADGIMSGTEGKALRLEAIRIELTGAAAENYDVYYQVHAQNTGWMAFAKNGEDAGTAGFGYRLEGIHVIVVPKGQAAPTPEEGSIETAFLVKN
jgi:Bacterial surface proteins containing Ig-like domains